MERRETKYSKLISLRMPHELIKKIEGVVEFRQKMRVTKVTFSEVIIDILERYFN